MMTLRKLIVAGALFVATSPSFAEDAHHPAGAEAAAAPAASPMSGGQEGTMGAGMMSMMDMMRSGAMPMMEQMMAPEHIEGRIAFLKTELEITPAQQKLWDAFTDALRTDAQAMSGKMVAMQGGMMSPQSGAAQTLTQRVEASEGLLNGRLEALRGLKAALQPLYAALDSKQKQMADKLLMPAPMGPM